MIKESLSIKGSSVVPIKTKELVYTLLNNIGEDPLREGLIRTPERFEKAMAELTSGYKQNIAQEIGAGIFKSEQAGLVSVREIEFFSLFEHHMLPFWGKASIAYYPDQSILGLSKLARVVDVYSKRLQVQERLTKEVAECISNLVKPRAVAVKIEANHMCMMMRGVKKINSSTSTEFSVNLEKLTADEATRLWKAID